MPLHRLLGLFTMSEKTGSKKIGILTGGGDCPGLNAAIRSIVLTGDDLGWSFVGIENSFNGLFQRPISQRPLDAASVQPILFQGGTILGTTSRGNPFQYRDKPAEADAGNKLDLALEACKSLGLDALIVIGGDGTQTMASALTEKGFPVVGIPKTIDNDLMATELTIGFQTAVEIAAESVARLRSTAESHRRIMAVEVMGRDSGYIALHSGLASGADAILIPEIPIDFDVIYKDIKEKMTSKLQSSYLLVVAEGASVEKGEQEYLETVTGSYKLGGVSHRVAKDLHEKTQMDSRVTVLGHTQRGGSPNYADRILATQYGVKAIEMIQNKQFGKLASYQKGAMAEISYGDVKNKRRPVALDNPLIETAIRAGVCLGNTISTT